MSSPRLYKHALESIFKFFSLKEMCRARSVSHDWVAAVDSMHCADSQCTIGRDNLLEICGSPIVRHLGKLVFDDSLILNQRALMVYGQRCTNLHTLVCTLMYHTSFLPNVFTFPPKLTNLNVRIKEESPVVVNSMLEGISGLSNLRVLKLQMYRWSEQIVLTSLSRIETLEELGIKVDNTSGWCFSEAHLAQLHNMPHLRVLGFPFSPREMSKVLSRSQSSSSTRLRWEDVTVCSLSTHVRESLASLDHLSTLGVIVCKNVGLEFLHSLPNLQNLRIKHLAYTAKGHLPQIRSGDKHMLSRLTIGQSNYNATELKRSLVAHASRLVTLVIHNFPSLESLCFLAATPDLTLLKMKDCQNHHLVSSELVHLTRLTRLTDLHIDSCFGEKLDSWTRQELRVPSLRIPSLKISCIINCH